MKQPTLVSSNIHGHQCCHDYKITNYIYDTPDGYCIVMGDDGRSHVVNKNCVIGSGFKTPEISNTVIKEHHV